MNATFFLVLTENRCTREMVCNIFLLRAQPNPHPPHHHHRIPRAMLSPGTAFFGAALYMTWPQTAMLGTVLLGLVLTLNRSWFELCRESLFLLFATMLLALALNLCLASPITDVGLSSILGFSLTIALCSMQIVDLLCGLCGARSAVLIGARARASPPTPRRPRTSSTPHGIARCRRVGRRDRSAPKPAGVGDQARALTAQPSACTAQARRRAADAGADICGLLARRGGALPRRLSCDLMPTAVAARA